MVGWMEAEDPPANNSAAAAPRRRKPRGAKNRGQSRYPAPPGANDRVASASSPWVPHWVRIPPVRTGVLQLYGAVTVTKGQRHVSIVFADRLTCAEKVSAQIQPRCRGVVLTSAPGTPRRCGRSYGYVVSDRRQLDIDGLSPQQPVRYGNEPAL